MAKIILVADDLTGALDAGACLLPALVQVETSAQGVDASLMSACPSALAVNASTRHLVAEDAAEVVAGLVGFAREAGTPCIVKKTDSALRGNVGAELEAALLASGCERLHFIPALPDMDRVTRGGIHYVDGEPVERSSFGRDPFEPVSCSNVVELVRLQASVDVRCVAEGESVPMDARGIVVYDCTSASSLEARVRELADLGELGMVAGCAGIARALAKVFGLEAADDKSVDEKTNLLVVCGSVNQASREQCAFAERRGACVTHIAEAEKADDAWHAGSGCSAFAERVSAQWAEAPLTVVNGSGLEDLTALVPADADVRQVVADHIGALLVRICERGIHGRALVTGGDVLASFLAQAKIQRLRPLCQPEPGIVAFELEMGSQRLVIYSKSGGFGTRELLVSMAGGNLNNEKEC